MMTAHTPAKQFYAFEDVFGLRIEGQKLPRQAVLRTENPKVQFLIKAAEDRQPHAKEGKDSRLKMKHSR